MFQIRELRVFLIQMLVILASIPEQYDCLIITSVLAGDKKFKTISFDTKFLKPLTFEKEMPLTEFRRHRTLRPPKFDIDINIPIKLPLEDEYAKEEPKKPVESNIFFQTGEIYEPYSKKSYSKKKASYQNELAYAAGTNQQSQVPLPSEQLEGLNQNSNQQALFQPNEMVQASTQVGMQRNSAISEASARSDSKEVQQLEEAKQEVMAQQSSNVDYSSKNYPTKQAYNEYQQEFVPGGFVNMQLSGPTGGPKMTYADYDREKWAQTLSQTPGAMPYPILNYQQLQNFYGGLGTFTNGLADNRYVEFGIKDKVKTALNKLANKIYWGVDH